MAEAINVAVNGASGRMGRLLCERIVSDRDDRSRFQLVAAVAHAGSEAIGASSVPGSPNAPRLSAEYAGPCDVVIDFSLPEGVSRAIEIARQAGAALLVATTGLEEHHHDRLREASRSIPVLVAPNTSPGVTAGLDLVERAARALGPGARVEIVEAHHRFKKDAPSGTALALGRAAEAGGSPMRPGQYHAMRGGDVIGEHTVRLFGEEEYLEIRHVAQSRALFASGALRAAAWLVEQRDRPGLYSMRDLIDRP